MIRSINLLPAERKNIIKTDNFNQFLFKVGFVVIFSILLFIVFLLANLFIINIYKKINQDEIKRTESGELSVIIQKAKTKIDDNYLKTNQSVIEIKKRISYWNYLNQINQVLPENVYYSKLTLEAGKMKLEGLAKNRNDLVKFKEILEQDKNFTEVKMPISNFTSQENINFEINLEFLVTNSFLE
jgi:Tfp pilus assembly protein PilN